MYKRLLEIPNWIIFCVFGLRVDPAVVHPLPGFECVYIQIYIDFHRIVHANQQGISKTIYIHIFIKYTYYYWSYIVSRDWVNYVLRSWQGSQYCIYICFVIILIINFFPFKIFLKNILFQWLLIYYVITVWY